MNRLWGVLLAVVLSGGCACAQHPAPQSLDDRENAAMASLKARYKDVVTGTEVKGTTLFVYVDINSLYSMEESDETAFKHDALARWRTAWLRAHQNAGHPTLTVSFRDYYGREVGKESARA